MNLGLGYAAPKEHEAPPMGNNSALSSRERANLNQTPDPGKWTLSPRFAPDTGFLELKAPGEADLLAK